MEKPPVETQIREGKREDAGGIARVHVKSWRETYRGLLPQSILDGLSENERDKQWRKILIEKKSRESLRVLEHGPQVVGFYHCGPARETTTGCDGEIFAIYLLAAFQKQGFGRRLLEAAFADLREQKFSSAYLWCLENNPTVGFYKHMGAVVGGPSKILNLRGTEVREVTFTWRLTPP